MQREAVFVNIYGGPCFRLGQPGSWDAAISRWYRVDDTRRAGTHRIRHEGRWYDLAKDTVAVEVRTVNAYGQGIGSDRHARAIPIPYSAMKRK